MTHKTTDEHAAQLAPLTGKNARLLDTIRTAEAVTHDIDAVLARAIVRPASRSIWAAIRGVWKWMNFETNERGGWIVPDGTMLPDHTVIPAYSVIGNRCELGNWCKLGDECKLGNWCKLGNGCKLGDRCKLGNGCTLGDECKLGNGCKLGDRCKLGNGCTLGDECKLGNGCKLGDECKLGNVCKLGNGCELGDRCALGNGCKLEGIRAKRWMTAANIDGYGRQILIVWDGEQTVIRAGCFKGTPEQFAEKAASEGKHIYARVIPAMVAALIGGEA